VYPLFFLVLAKPYHLPTPHHPTVFSITLRVAAHRISLVLLLSVVDILLLFVVVIVIHILTLLCPPQPKAPFAIILALLHLRPL
jgi:hypothetical protein